LPVNVYCLGKQVLFLPPGPTASRTLLTRGVAYPG